MAVVVVESPAKAKTINKYLGSNYTVLASYGHVRDLPKKDGSVKPDEDFSMEWEVDGDGAKRVRAIAEAIKKEADDGDELPLGDLDVDVLQDLGVAVGFGRVFQCQNAHTDHRVAEKVNMDWSAYIRRSKR